MKALKTIGEYIDKVVNIICIFLLAVMTGIVLLQVSTRILPVRNPNWTEELSRYLMIYIAFVGASTGIREWTNVGVDFILERLPKAAKYAVNVIIRLAILVFWCVVLYLAATIFPKTGMRQLSASMRFPLFYAQCSLIVGAALCIVQCFIQTITYLAGGVKNA